MESITKQPRLIAEWDSSQLLGQYSKGPKASLPPISTGPFKTSPQPTTDSVVSSPVSYQESTTPSNPYSPTVFSIKSSRSSSASSAPSTEADAVAEAQDTMSNSTRGNSYELPCILCNIVACPASFRASEFRYWYSHSLSHYPHTGPPNHAMCIFCPMIFDSKSPGMAWSERMEHIRDHFSGRLDGGPMVIEQSRADFGVLRDMYNKGCLPKTIWKHLEKGNERPRLDNLRPYDWEPPKLVARREAEERKANSIPVLESRQEQRRRLAGRSLAASRKNKNQK